MLSCLRPALKKRKRFAPESEGTPVGPPPPSSEKKVRFTPGKTLARAFGSADPDVDRTPIELPFHCDGCGNYILTTRMNCAACSDYDLCETCFEALERGEPGRGPAHEHPAAAFVVADVDEAGTSEPPPTHPPGPSRGDDRAGDDDDARGVSEGTELGGATPTTPVGGATTPVPTIGRGLTGGTPAVVGDEGEAGAGRTNTSSSLLVDDDAADDAPATRVEPVAAPAFEADEAATGGEDANESDVKAGA